MPENQQPPDERTREALGKAYSEAAARARDLGDEAAAHSFTTAALKFGSESEKK
ncbi:hypothetical protein [Streptomyces griseosporeus]|uniref:hypothetical protein n=1 Tax=Streptomyces griseosporeus TaxID=1910 RepID=UPI0036F71C60